MMGSQITNMNFVLLYPVGLYMVDRTKSSTNSTEDQLGWWKTNCPVEWSIIMVFTDLIHFKTFIFGVYYITDFDELWIESISRWQPLHQGWPTPCKQFYLSSDSPFSDISRTTWASQLDNGPIHMDHPMLAKGWLYLYSMGWPRAYCTRMARADATLYHTTWVGQRNIVPYSTGGPRL